MMCDALGLPIKFTVTGGEVSDFTQAIFLLTDEKTDYVIADKGYDGNEIIEHISKNMHATPVIPPRSNRLIQREYDKHIYKERNLIERLFNRLKNFRKLATRYEKIKKNFESLIFLACSFLWLI
jgi:transposase